MEYQVKIEITLEKYQQSDFFEASFSLSAKDRTRIQYYLKEYTGKEKGNWYLAKDITINPNGNQPSRGCSGDSVHEVDGDLIAPYVEDLQLIPKDKDGNVLYPVCTSCSNAESSNNGANKSIENMKKVHTVDVYLTLRSPKEVYNKAQVTKIINGEAPYGSNINVPADKYYRETFFVSVHTRNLAKPIAISEKTGTSIGQTSSYNK